jgi:hypothetical protein
VQEQKQPQPNPAEISEMPFKETIGHFQSFCLLMVVLGSIEVGFLYTTMVGYLLMTVAYYEMIKL